ncbi:MAG: hypothetical protein WCX88_02310 [Patescibacteria group bacterium]
MKNNFDDKDLEQKVMGQIESGRVKLRSRYIFWAQNLGLGSAIVLSFILGILLLSLIVLSFKLTGNLNYLAFGKLGWLAFLESFPYGLIIFAVIAVLLVGYFIKKSQWFYKLKFGYLAIGLISLLIILGAGIAFVEIPEWIASKMMFFGRGPQMVNSFILPKSCNCGRGLMGKIIEIDNKFIIVQESCGSRRAIFIDEPERFLPPLDFLNKFIVAVGEPEPEIFKIHQFKISDRQPRPDVNKNFGCPLCQKNEINFN